MRTPSPNSVVGTSIITEFIKCSLGSLFQIVFLKLVEDVVGNFHLCDVICQLVQEFRALGHLFLEVSTDYLSEVVHHSFVLGRGQFDSMFHLVGNNKVFSGAVSRLNKCDLLLVWVNKVFARVLGFLASAAAAAAASAATAAIAVLIRIGPISGPVIDLEVGVVDRIGSTINGLVIGQEVGYFTGTTFNCLLIGLEDNIINERGVILFSLDEHGKLIHDTRKIAKLDRVGHGEEGNG